MDFFKGFEASDWTTFVVAVLALLVSIGSLVQNWRFRPRPHISVEWSHWADENENGVVQAYFRFWNDGEATAHNVRLYVEDRRIVSRMDEPYWERWTKVEPGADLIQVLVPLEPAEYAWLSLGVRGFYRPDGAGHSGMIRDSLLHPVVKIRYRGRIRSVRSRAPEIEQVMDAC